MDERTLTEAEWACFGRCLYRMARDEVKGKRDLYAVWDGSSMSTGVQVERHRRQRDDVLDWLENVPRYLLQSIMEQREDAA